MIQLLMFYYYQLNIYHLSHNYENVTKNIKEDCMLADFFIYCKLSMDSKFNLMAMDRVLPTHVMYLPSE